jgi:hypothetical protein
MQSQPGASSLPSPREWSIQVKTVDQIQQQAVMDDLFDSVHSLEQTFIEEGAKEGRR